MESNLLFIRSPPIEPNDRPGIVSVEARAGIELEPSCGRERAGAAQAGDHGRLSPTGPMRLQRGPDLAVSIPVRAQATEAPGLLNDSRSMLVLDHSFAAWSAQTLHDFLFIIFQVRRL